MSLRLLFLPILLSFKITDCNEKLVGRFERQVPGVRCQVSDARCAASRCQVQGSKCQVPGAQVPAVRCQVPGARDQVVRNHVSDFRDQFPKYK